jgi:glycine cleavage system aminomethyltransferase T
MIDLSAGHDFIGRAALERIAARGPARRRMGVVIDGAPVAGNAQPLILRQNGLAVGHVSEIAHSRRHGCEYRRRSRPRADAGHRDRPHPDAAGRG